MSFSGGISVDYFEQSQHLHAYQHKFQQKQRRKRLFVLLATLIIVIPIAVTVAILVTKYKNNKEILVNRAICLNRYNTYYLYKKFLD